MEGKQREYKSQKQWALQGNSILSTQQSSFRYELKEILTAFKQSLKTQTRLTPSMEREM